MWIIVHFFSASNGRTRTHLFFKKILPVFFAVFFSVDIEVCDGKTFSSINNPCIPMKYPFGINICLYAKFLPVILVSHGHKAKRCASPWPIPCTYKERLLAGSRKVPMKTKKCINLLSYSSSRHVKVQVYVSSSYVFCCSAFKFWLTKEVI